MSGYLICILLLVAELVALKQELKLVQVLFVHPTEYSFPAHSVAIDTVENAPEEDPTLNRSAMDTMSNEEKRIIYDLGVRLRKKYDTFLGDVYTHDISSTRTTDSDVSMMSGGLLDAGLWPPSEEQRWMEGFLWQPIPIEYVPRTEDTLLMGRLCPAFIKATNVVRKSMEIFEMEKEHRKLYSLVSQETGLGITSSQDIAYLYKSLKARASRNLTLPAWANGIYPNGEMLNVTFLEDDILSKTDVQRKLNGGFLVQKILADSAARAKGLSDTRRKITIYNGDSDLFIGVLHGLGVWHPHVPNTGSALIFELLYDQESQTYGMKIFYDLGRENLIMRLKIPGCNATQDPTACTLESLNLSFANILPGDDDALCGRTIEKPKIPSEEDVNAKITSSMASTRSTYGLFVVSCVLMLICML